jgi:hypothetical protein
MKLLRKNGIYFQYFGATRERTSGAHQTKSVPQSLLLTIFFLLPVLNESGEAGGGRVRWFVMNNNSGNAPYYSTWRLFSKGKNKSSTPSWMNKLIFFHVEVN